MSQKPQQDGMPNAEAVDLPEISVEYSTEFLTGSAPCAGVSRPLPAAWLGQRGIYRSRFEAVCNGEQLVEPLTLGELIQRAWPSPSTELAERGTQHRFSTTEQTCRHDFAGVWWNDNGVTQTGHECRHCGFFVADVTEAPAEQAEAERPEVVAWRYGFSGGIVSDKACLDEWKSGGEYQSLMTVVQHERIVVAEKGKTAAVMLESHRQFVRQFEEGTAELIAQRDAALARVAELELKLDQSDYAYDNDRHHMRGMAKQAAEAIQVFTGHDSSANLAHRYGEKWWEHLDELRDALLAFAKNAPVAQPEEMPGEILAAKLIETWVTKHGKPAPWSTAVEITAVATNMPNDERDRLLALDDDVDAQAQHSVPDGLRELLEMLVVSDLRKVRYAGAWRREVHNRASSILALLAAAPGTEVPQAWLDVQAERKRQIEAEGWTPEHDDEHDDEHDTGALASAAGCYAMFSLAYPAGDPSHFWPWDKSWWKPSPDGRRNMVKAGALILAEIERLDRVAASQGGPSDA
ncbi:hypothetical protein ACYTSF_18380 [Pseudomonas aeruginosa]